uniref:Uncharacterized protein n=1 Tax=Tanacetum cinerariifolium TaxID=118510 RepID=A0A699GJC2_TANCI|nr:hypothetical protein [Tanacetum cinerariifolium]
MGQRGHVGHAVHHHAHHAVADVEDDDDGELVVAGRAEIELDAHVHDRHDDAAQVDHALDELGSVGDAGGRFVAADLAHLLDVDTVFFLAEGKSQFARPLASAPDRHCYRKSRSRWRRRPRYQPPAPGVAQRRRAAGRPPGGRRAGGHGRLLPARPGEPAQKPSRPPPGLAPGGATGYRPAGGRRFSAGAPGRRGACHRMPQFFRRPARPHQRGADRAGRRPPRRPRRRGPGAPVLHRRPHGLRAGPRRRPAGAPPPARRQGICARSHRDQAGRATRHDADGRRPPPGRTAAAGTAGLPRPLCGRMGVKSGAATPVHAAARAGNLNFVLRPRGPPPRAPVFDGRHGRQFPRHRVGAQPGLPVHRPRDRRHVVGQHVGGIGLRLRHLDAGQPRQELRQGGCGVRPRFHLRPDAGRPAGQRGPAPALLRGGRAVRRQFHLRLFRRAGIAAAVGARAVQPGAPQPVHVAGQAGTAHRYPGPDPHLRAGHVRADDAQHHLGAVHDVPLRLDAGPERLCAVLRGPHGRRGAGGPARDADPALGRGAAVDAGIDLGRRGLPGLRPGHARLDDVRRHRVQRAGVCRRAGPAKPDLARHPGRRTGRLPLSSRAVISPIIRNSTLHEPVFPVRRHCLRGAWRGFPLRRGRRVLAADRGARVGQRCQRANGRRRHPRHLPRPAARRGRQRRLQLRFYAGAARAPGGAVWPGPGRHPDSRLAHDGARPARHVRAADLHPPDAHFGRGQPRAGHQRAGPAGPARSARGRGARLRLRRGVHGADGGTGQAGTPVRGSGCDVGGAAAARRFRRSHHHGAIDHDQRGPARAARAGPVRAAAHRRHRRAAVALQRRLCLEGAAEGRPAAAAGRAGKSRPDQQRHGRLRALLRPRPAQGRGASALVDCTSTTGSSMLLPWTPAWNTRSREPAGLDLHHHPVARQKHVVRIGQREAVVFHRIGGDRRRRFQAVAIAAPEDVHRNAQLVAAHLGLRRHLVGVHVDQLDHPVGVGAGGGREQVHHGRAGDAQRRLQRSGHVGQHVGAVRVAALVAHQPWRPHTAVGHAHRARHERHRLGRIGHVFVVRATGRGVLGRVEAEAEAGLQIHRFQRRGATVGARQRPLFQALPAVDARLIEQHRRRIGLRRAVLQVLVEERHHVVAPELERRIARELERAQVRAVVIDAAVAPRAHHQVIPVIGLILRLHCRVRGVGAVDILLVPVADHCHGGYLERLFGQDLVERLVLPVAVVGGMLEQLAREIEPVEAELPGVVAGRAGAQHALVIVVHAGGQRLAGALGRGLAGDVMEVVDAEGAVVEPVVAAPAVHHRAHRHGRLQRRMRVGQRHQHREALVRRADHADLAVGLGEVFHEPVDGVPGVRRVVGAGVVERALEGARHHVVAVGAVLAAHVLEGADIAGIDQHLVALGQGGGHAGADVALGAAAGVVRGAGEDDGRFGVLAGRLGDHDHGMELDAVAHRDHDLALDVVGVGRERLEFGGNVGRHGRGLGHGVGRGGSEQGGQQRNRQQSNTHTILGKYCQKAHPTEGCGLAQRSIRHCGKLDTRARGRLDRPPPNCNHTA